jgi:hypothetical protein
MNWTQDPVTLAPSSVAPDPTDADGPDDIYFDGDIIRRAGGSSGMVQWASGNVKSMHLVNTFAGTVQMGSISAETYVQRAGNISQSSGTTLTVTGSFDWTGGVLNSAANGATVALRGTTATITPGTGATLQTGSLLSFENSVRGTASSGTIQFNSTQTISVKGTSRLDVIGILLRSAGPNPNAITLPAGDSQKFYANNVYADMGLWVAGGTAYMVGGGDIEFYGSVNSVPPLTPPAGVLMTGGALVIENGTTLDVGLTQQVHMTGGKLATKPVNEAVQPRATIAGELLHVKGGEVVISDGSYAPEIVGHKYGVLEVRGEVFWERGVYKPTAGAPQNGRFADLWHATGNFVIGDQGPTGPRVEPISNGPALNTPYFIMSTGGVFEQETPPGVGPPPEFLPHTGTPLPSVLGYWEWDGAAFGQKNWAIEFLAD